MKDYIIDLVKSGFTEYEAKAYLTLLKKNNFSASEISKLSGVPRTKVYEILACLVRKGACIEIPGKIRRFKAVNPRNIFNNMLNNLEKEKTYLAAISESLVPYYEKAIENTDPLDYIEVIRKKKAVIEKIAFLEKKAQNYIITMNKPPYYIGIENFLEEKRMKTDLNNKLNYRYLYEVQGEMKDEGHIQIWNSIRKYGVNIRFCPKLPIKFMSFDDNIVILSLKDKVSNTESMTSMVIEHSDLAKTLKEIFEIYWENAVSFEDFFNNKKEKII